MIQINRIETFNWEGAFHGLRNPLNSWSKSDSNYYSFIVWNEENREKYNYREHFGDDFLIGPNDLALAQRMIAGGTDESKFMRQIFVSMDITAPWYWWKEMDTYKVATVANSCSTMHTLAKTPITTKMFSVDEDSLNLEVFKGGNKENGGDVGWFLNDIVSGCEELRKRYIETGDKRYWRVLIQLMPNSFNQMRTWTANYAVLRNIYFARRHHKLVEWHRFCEMIENLPYGKELICYEKEIK